MDAKGEQTAFVYTTYIQETPERVWQGLTDPALMKSYWRHQTAGPKTFHSDWKKGSTYEMAHDDVGLVVSGPDQVILESHPPHRLAYTWHTITPEWAAAVGMDEATAAAWRAEARSKVAFDIEDVGHGVVKLTVTHDASRRAARCCRPSPRGGPPSWPASRPCWRRGRLCAPRERPQQTTAQVPRPEPRPRQTPTSAPLDASPRPGATRPNAPLAGSSR
jgi:uncharacterized protein YndB with AHSA1/START domain